MASNVAISTARYDQLRGELTRTNPSPAAIAPVMSGMGTGALSAAGLSDAGYVAAPVPHTHARPSEVVATVPPAYPVSADQVVENAVALEVIGGRTQRPKDAPLTMTRVSSRRLSGENPQNALARSYSAKTQSHIQKGLKDVDKMGKERNKLGQWLSTGLCGNNITSSALYVVAICSVPAGKYAPIALGCIAVPLYLFVFRSTWISFSTH